MRRIDDTQGTWGYAVLLFGVWQEEIESLLGLGPLWASSLPPFLLEWALMMKMKKKMKMKMKMMMMMMMKKWKW